MSRRGGLRLIDVHCHLHDEAFDGDRDNVIKRALDNGVEVMVTSTLSLHELKKAFEIARRHEYVKVSAGFNPLNTSMTEAEELAREVKRVRNSILAIGEVGLDFFFMKGEDRDAQVKVFRFWISVASELKLPIVVHSRSAGRYAIELLIEEDYDRVLMHAFDGSSGWALKGVSKGFLFSIPPSIVRSRQKIKLVRSIPLDFLAVESDAPVLGPTPTERNEPLNIVVGATKIAEVKKIDLAEACEALYSNSKSFFKL
ncbi:MAG: TatD family hydrolase [Candidatus Nezhaarchaeales archaeon]